MTSSKDSKSKKTSYELGNLSSEEQRLFLQEKDKYVKRQINDTPLLDQVCLLHLIMAQLSEGYAKALADFEERLDARTRMLEGWRQSKIKKASESESPMPWLHPFKLAAEELQLLREQLEAAVMKGETEEKDVGKLREVMDKYQLQLPLPSHLIQPRYLPKSVRVYKQCFAEFYGMKMQSSLERALRHKEILGAQVLYTSMGCIIFVMTWASSSKLESVPVEEWKGDASFSSEPTLSFECALDISKAARLMGDKSGHSPQEVMDSLKRSANLLVQARKKGQIIPRLALIKEGLVPLYLSANSRSLKERLDVADRLLVRTDRNQLVVTAAQ